MIRAAPHPLLLIVALWLVGLGAAGQFAKISVTFPELQAIYPNAGASLGLALSLISGLGVALGLVAGMIVARLGVRRMLLGGLLLGTAMSAFQTTLPGFGLLLASRLIEGISHLVLVVAAPTLIAEIAPERLRGAALTLWSTFFGVAYAITAYAGRPLVLVYGPEALFAIHALWMLAMAAVLFVMLPRVRLVRDDTALDLPTILARHVTIYTSARISAPALGWLFYTLTFVALLTILPLVLGAPLWLLGALPLTSIAVSLTLGVALMRRFRAVQVTIAGFALSAVAACALIVWPDALAPVFALFSALALVQSASFAAVPELNASAADRALANGAMAQMGNLGNLTGTPLLMAAVSGFGSTGALVVVLLAYLAGLGVHLLLARNRRQTAF